MVKQIGAIPWIGETDVALEQLGYNDEQIQRMSVTKKEIEGKELANSIVNNKALEAQAQILQGQKQQSAQMQAQPFTGQNSDE